MFAILDAIKVRFFCQTVITNVEKFAIKAAYFARNQMLI